MQQLVWYLSGDIKVMTGGSGAKWTGRRRGIPVLTALQSGNKRSRSGLVHMATAAKRGALNRSGAVEFGGNLWDRVAITGMRGHMPSFAPGLARGGGA